MPGSAVCCPPPLPNLPTAVAMPPKRTRTTAAAATRSSKRINVRREVAAQPELPPPEEKDIEEAGDAAVPAAGLIDLAPAEPDSVAEAPGAFDAGQVIRALRNRPRDSASDEDDVNMDDEVELQAHQPDAADEEAEGEEEDDEEDDDEDDDD